MILRGFHIGWKAVQRNWLPALILQGVMIALGIGYWSEIEMIRVVFQEFQSWKEKGGYLFSILAAAFAAGFVSEVFRVYFVDGAQWRREHVDNIIFKCLLMGFLGMTTDYFYRLQGVWFGNGTDWMTLHKKVIVDMLGYSGLVTAPLQSVLFCWKEEGYSWSRARKKIFPLREFLGNRYIPFILSNLCFWLPIVYVIYSMPPLLQMPLNLIAASIWGILIVTVAQESRTRIEN